MAVRSPLYYTDSGNLKEMSLLELNDIYAQGKKAFLANPAVELTVVGSGGNLGNLSETHVIASAVRNNNRRFSNNDGSLGNI
jgi:phage terminase large subunit-like protein